MPSFLANKLRLRGGQFTLILTPDVTPAGAGKLNLVGGAFTVATPSVTGAFNAASLLLRAGSFGLANFQPAKANAARLTLRAKAPIRVGRGGLVPTVPVTELLIPTIAVSELLVPTVPGSESDLSEQEVFVSGQGGAVTVEGVLTVMAGSEFDMSEEVFVSGQGETVTVEGVLTSAALGLLVPTTERRV